MLYRRVLCEWLDRYDRIKIIIWFIRTSSSCSVSYCISQAFCVPVVKVKKYKKKLKIVSHALKISHGGDHFSLTWLFQTVVTVFYCCLMWRWPFHTQNDRVSVFVRDNLMQRSYCLQKYGVSVSLHKNIMRRSYCLKKNEVSVLVCKNLILSLHCPWGDIVYILHTAI